MTTNSDGLQRLPDVLRHIEEGQQGFVERSLAYVSRPSISAHGVGIGETAEWLLASLQELGMEARLLPGKGWPFVYGRRSDVAAKDVPTVLLYGHYDVQPPDPLEE